MTVSEIDKHEGGFLSIKVTMKKEDLWDYVDYAAHNEYWEWMRYKLHSGNSYGVMVIEGKNEMAHRMAQELTNGKILKGLFVLHHCDNPPCVNPDHLYIGTRQDNADDMCRRGRSAKGMDNGRSKLSDNNVLEIRKVYQLNRYTYKEIGAMYGVSYHVIFCIIKNKTWKHLKM